MGYPHTRLALWTCSTGFALRTCGALWTCRTLRTRRALQTDGTLYAIEHSEGVHRLGGGDGHEIAVGNWRYGNRRGDAVLSGETWLTSWTLRAWGTLWTRRALRTSGALRAFSIARCGRIQSIGHAQQLLAGPYRIIRAAVRVNAHIQKKHAAFPIDGAEVSIGECPFSDVQC